MSSRSFKVLLEDMLDAIGQIDVYTAEMDEAEFSKDRKTQDAVVRNLEVLGEAAGRLPGSYREQHAEIPWAMVRGMRNRIVHAYFGVDLQLIWEVVQDDLPPLKSHVAELLGDAAD